MELATRNHNRDNEPSAAVVFQAAEWLAYIESGDASDADHVDLEAWRRADPTHAVAFDRLSGVRVTLAGAPEVEQETLRRILLSSRRQMGASLLGFLALIGAGWLVSTQPAVQLYFADQKTAVGETHVVSLSDGSSLTLSTNSAVNVDVRDGKHAVQLLRGELLAHVSKGRRLPFEVTTEDGAAIALGTAYTVSKEPESTIVAVAESRVRVCPALEKEAECLTLAAGQRARMTRTRVARLPDVAAADVGAWADGWLSVDDRPLVEVLDELNRWRTTPIGFDRSILAGLRVSGIFPLGDTDRAATNLGKLLPISIDKSDPEKPVIRRR